jgi:medium-chain acyl-[acyl-carrier-protein] hydrolase
MSNNHASFAAATSTTWFPSLRRRAFSDVRLFCFPYAGGSAAIYQRWQAGLPDGVEVCPAHLPGRGARLSETPYNNSRPLVEALCDNIGPHLDKPFAFFGHSMGALIAFELARELRRRGEPLPLCLYISGRSAPQLADPDSPKHDLPEEEFIAELRKLNGTPKEVLENAELMHIMSPLLRADFAVCETYSYESEPPLGCPIAAFGGLQDFEVGRERVAAWREQTSGRFSLRMLPGDHFYLNSQSALLLQVLAQDLRQVVSMVA